MAFVGLECASELSLPRCAAVAGGEEAFAADHFPCEDAEERADKDSDDSADGSPASGAELLH